MPTSSLAQRLSYIFLCSGPFHVIVLVGIKALREPVVHQVMGGVIFTLFVIAIWVLAGRGFRAQQPEMRLAAIAGILLLLPFALIGLLWVGLGPPWLATPVENQMRYVVLTTSAAAVVSGSVVLKEALGLTGERCYSTLGFAGMLLAGPLYLVGESILLAAFSAEIRTGQVPEVFRSLSEFQDVLLFFGGALTYAATAAFAVSLYKAGWLGRTASRIYVGISFLAPCASSQEVFSFRILRRNQCPGTSCRALLRVSLPCRLSFLISLASLHFETLIERASLIKEALREAAQRSEKKWTAMKRSTRW